jgi:hypothetical protein
LLFFETLNIKGEYFSPADVARSLSLLFAARSVVEDFGRVDITIIPTPNAVEGILSLRGLSKLSIRLNAPNPDDFASDEAQYAEMLHRNNARTWDTILLKERKAESLTPDEEIRRMALVASRNGHVEGNGIDSKGNPVVESTRRQPLRTRFPLNDLSTSPLDALLSYLVGWKDRS